MSIKAELRTLERQKTRLAKMEKDLHSRARAQKQFTAKLDSMVRACGMEPRDLVFALVDHYNVRLAGRRKGQRARRKRTKITPALRDAVKKTVAGGRSMNRTSKEFGISYAVVLKMIRGGYEKLK